MKRHELEHIIRAASGISGRKEIVIIGSQSILGQFPDAPAECVESIEADVFTFDLNQESIRIFRNPQNGRYTSETTAADFAPPLAFPDLKLDIRALFEGSDQD